ncbi:GWxTD domain-containing protein [Patescibacteria group bacterium]|nr:GWxTD domain-containing protein [Patescibacteria group bacterium]
MKKLSVMVAILLLSLLMIDCGSSRTHSKTSLDYPRPINQAKNKPRFYVEAISIADSVSNKTSGSSIIKIYIPYSELLFEKTSQGGWQGSFEAQTTLTHQGITYGYFSKIGTTLTITNYEDTKNKHLYAMIDIKYTASPSHYLLNVRVTDRSNHTTSSLTMPMAIRGISENTFDISDLVTIQSGANGEFTFISTDTTDKNLSFRAANYQILNPWRPAAFLFDIYWPLNLQNDSSDLVIEYQLEDQDGIIFIKQGIFKNEVIKSSRIIAGIQFFLPENLGSGNYTLVVHTHVKNRNTGSNILYSYIVTKPIRFYSFIPRSKLEIANAIGPLKLIAPDSVLKNLKNAKTRKEKAKIFFDFWKKYDSVVMTEFYQRVEYSNKHFGSRRQGWNSDQGRVYIRFGPPSDISRYVMPRNNISHEYWHYRNRSTANVSSPFYHKVFIFVDEYSIGDYTFGRGDIWSHNLNEYDHY